VSRSTIPCGVQLLADMPAPAIGRVDDGRTSERVFSAARGAGLDMMYLCRL
jgi:hypothetical protein